MAHRIIQNEADLAALGTVFANMKLPFTVQWVQGRDRSHDQNALQWLWAGEAAEQYGDRTQTEVQHDWKLRHGVPILREDNIDFRAIYDAMLKPLPYEGKVKLMAFMPITSEMKVPQMVRYLDTIHRECGEQGIRLTEPSSDLAQYQQRYRGREAA